jgi:LacI family transcriptional regulator
LYVAVRNHVHAAIESGRVSPGDRLPSTKALSQQLDVSLVTVHRALNELVSAGVLKRGQGRGTFVHEDYAKPGHIATDMRFGLVFHPESTMADPYHGRVLQGVRDASAESGVDLVLLRYGEDWRKECSGYIYVNPVPEQLDHSPRFGSSRNGEGRVQSAGSVPVVGVGVNPGLRTDVCAVDSDNIAMIREAVQLVHAAGHRRIAYLGDGSSVSNSVDRERGFREGCAATGIDLKDAMIIRSQGWATSDAAVEHLIERLSVADRPTAVVAGGYYLALDVYAAAKRMGLSIPEDLSVTGVDDPPSAAYLSPAMTTFCQPLEEIGRLAVSLLLERVRGGGEVGGGRLLRAEVRMRESVAAPADADGMTKKQKAPGVDRAGRSETNGREEVRHAAG